MTIILFFIFLFLLFLFKSSDVLIYSNVVTPQLSDERGDFFFVIIIPRLLWKPRQRKKFRSRQQEIRQRHAWGWIPKSISFGTPDSDANGRQLHSQSDLV